MQQFLRDIHNRVVGEIVFSGSTIVLRDSNHCKIGEHRSDDEFVQLDAATWSTIKTAACWIGLILIGFVALMVKYPRLATAVQTVTCRAEP